MIIGVSGACRSDELFKMNKKDVDVQEEKVIVFIPHTKTYQPRSFIIIEKDWMRIIKEYIQLTSKVENERFFLQVRQGKATKQPYGHNSIAQFPKKIATYLNLNNVNTYTGHCFRRTAATLVADNGADILDVKQIGGWKSSAVAEGYVDTSLNSRIKIANMLSTKSTENSSCIDNPDLPGPSTSTQKFNFSRENLQQGISLNITGHDNATFNFHFTGHSNSNNNV